MTDQPTATDLNPEQRQRQIAVETAAKVLRTGGASLASNNGTPASVQDIVDLAHYIGYGEPYAVAHNHEHIADVGLIVGKVGQSLTDLLNEAMNEGQKQDTEPEAPDFDFD